MTRLEREVRFLKIYAAVSTFLFAGLFLAAFAAQKERPKLEEIDVERINIVEKDGKLRMVISNQARQHPGIVNGKLIERKQGRPPGMIFFNHLGDEMGGLVFGENGGVGHFGQLTWDKVRNDQTIGFRHLESDDGTYRVGLEMWQRPNIPGDVAQAKLDAVNQLPDQAQREAALQAMRDRNELATQRLFLGKQRDDSSLLLMSDIKGRPRIRMQVPAAGAAKLEFLDEAGKVVYALPESSTAPKP